MNLDDSLGALLNRTAADIRSALEARLAAYELTAPQWAVLARVQHQPGLNLTELARLLGYDKPTTSGIVSRLVARGVVDKRPSPDDARASLLYLNSAGEALFAPLPAHARAVNAQALAGLSEGEALLLLELLRKVRRNLQG